jgi:integrase
MYRLNEHGKKRAPWNKGRLMGQKQPLSLQEIWSIRMRLQSEKRLRDMALFNLAIDSKLRACDLLNIRVSDVSSGGQVNSRATIMQQKTRRPVRFEITSRTRGSIENWIEAAELGSTRYLFPSRIHDSLHLSTRQYARIVESWVTGIGLDPASYGTHSLRRTKATLIYRRTKNLRAVQLLLGHAKLDSTVRYLGIEIDDALEMSEQIDV